MAEDNKPRRRVSGPGAADMLTAPDGADRPEAIRDLEPEQEALTDERERLAPDLEVPENQKERWIQQGQRPSKDSGS